MRMLVLAHPHKGCGRMRITADPLNEYVSRLVADRPALRASWPVIDPATIAQYVQEDIARVEAQLATLATHRYVDESIGDVEYQSAATGLRVRLEELEQDVTSSSPLTTACFVT